MIHPDPSRPRPVPTRAVLRFGLPLLALAAVSACAPAEETPAEDAATESTPAPAAPVSEGPDLWVAEMTWENGRPVIRGLRNATDRAGYDNQPSFFPDGAIRYTREANGNTDIWRLDPAGGDATPVTSTAPESEYSATADPSGTRFHAIRVEADSTQRLWAFDMSGTDIGPVFTELAPVGYHAFIDDDRIAMFVLGNPATLRVGRISTQEVETWAEGIGRSINAIPGRTAVSFPLVQEDGTMISMWEEGEITPIVASRPGSQDHAWGNGLIFQAEGSRLYTWDPANPDEGWVEALDLSTEGVQITRLAIRADAGMIVIVGEVTPAED